MSDTEGQDALHRLCADLKRLHMECTGLTLEGLARACNLSRTQIGDILNGNIRRLPDRDVVLAIVGKCASYASDHQITLSLSTEKDNWRVAHAVVERSQANGQSPRSKSVPEDPWIDLVRQHIDDDAVCRHAVTIARHLATQRRVAARKLKGDPWLDPDLARRVVDHVTALATEASAGASDRLSGTEKALLVITPLLHQVRWLRAALIDIDPLDLRQTGASDPDRAGFERFLRGRQQQRLVARATQRELSDRTADSAEIGWWLFHRWLDTRPPDPRATVQLDEVIDDRRLRGMLLEPLDRLVRLFRLSAGELRNAERLDLPAEFGGSLGVPGVRLRLVGLLLVVAHSLAIEIATLSSTIVEHLGIPEPVDLGGLRETLKDSDWKRGGADLDLWLYARCQHEAVLEALTEHASRTDAILAAVHAIAQHDTTLQPLRSLPARASADQVLPRLVDSEPLFAVPVTRFRLDETRIRELLMGEQLYRDRSLAIRELYQNALDACRYRQARHDYQAREWGLRSVWRGQITFDQGVDASGRHYLRCRDNGVGMSELDLREVFSQAGMRFADRPEFAEEQAEWARCGVELHPNSRFGIGVMSYFMLADEIEVTTCRMSRQAGPPGPRLKVVIAGPGHLFRIKQVAQHGDEPGTEVKLYLRPGEDAPSCVRTLRALLGIAEFATRAEHEGVSAEWEPFVFQARESQSWEPGGINAYGRLEPGMPGEHGQVIWCEYGGALLADGIYVQAKAQSHDMANRPEDDHPRGAVINLAGSWAPLLTVDRMSVLGDVSDHVLALLANNTNPLVRPESSLLSYEWIIDVARTSPDIADLVTTAAANVGKTLCLGEQEIDVRRAGVWAIDVHLTETPGILHGESERVDRWKGVDHLLLWRLLALVDDALGAAVEYPEMMPIRDPRVAKPSDINLLGSWRHYPHYDIDTEINQIGLTVKKAGILGCGLSEAIQHLSDLGLAGSRIASLSSVGKVDAVDVVLLSKNLDGQWPWQSIEETVKLANVIAASVRTQLPPAQVRRRLMEFGFEVEPVTKLAVPLDSSDLRLVSRYLNSESPWLTLSTPVPALHVAYAAQLGHQSFAFVAARLVALGFTVSDISCHPTEIDNIDPQVRSAIADLMSPYGVSSPYQRSRIVRAAVKARCSPAVVGRYLTDLGVDLNGPGTLPDQLDDDTKRFVELASSDYELSVWDVLNISNKADAPTDLVRDRMIELGFKPSFALDFPDSLDDLSRRIIALSKYHRITTDREIPLIFVASTAATLNLPPAIIAHRLKVMGFSLPDTSHLPDHLSESDVRLCYIDHLGFNVIPVMRPVPLAHLVRVAHTSLLEPKTIADRLRKLGYQTPASNEMPEQFAQHDVRLLSWWSTAHTTWQDAYKPVPIGDLIRAAIRCRISITAAAERMTALGLEVPDLRTELPPLLAKVPQTRSGRP